MPTVRHLLLSTAIGLRKYRIPSDLRSQAEYRLVSTTVGDHVGILGAVVFAFAQCSWLCRCDMANSRGTWAEDLVVGHF
jgi:hypothetical protein